MTPTPAPRGQAALIAEMRAVLTEWRRTVYLHQGSTLSARTDALIGVDRPTPTTLAARKADR